MTRLQAERRRDPYPFTWEIPVGLLLTALLLAGFGVQAGRTLAYCQAGAGWHWPTGRALATSIPGILSGHPAAGLNPEPTVLLGSGVVLGWVLATEVVLFAGMLAAVLLLLRRWGPSRVRGVATPAEAEAVLGISRLRKQRAIIRPDLHATPRRRP